MTYAKCLFIIIYILTYVSWRTKIGRTKYVDDKKDGSLLTWFAVGSKNVKSFSNFVLHKNCLIN